MSGAVDRALSESKLLGKYTIGARAQHSANFLPERILIHTDIRTILLSQRISKIWQSSIKAAPSLQKKLFFQPCSPSDLITLHITADVQDSEFAFAVPLHMKNVRNVPASSLCMLNPLFRRSYGVNPTRSERDLRKGPDPELLAYTNLHLPVVKRRSNSKTSMALIGVQANGASVRNPSWLKMLLSQPPLLVIYPRGWDKPRLGGTVIESLRLIAIPLSGMFTVVAGFPIDKRGFWKDVATGQEEVMGDALENRNRNEEESYAREEQSGFEGQEEGGGMEMEESNVERVETVVYEDDVNMTSGEEVIPERHQTHDEEITAPLKEKSPEVIDVDKFEHSWWNEHEKKWDPGLAASWRLFEKANEDESLWGKPVWDEKTGNYIKGLEEMWGMPNDIWSMLDREE